METTATNKRLRELLTAVNDKTLIPRPDFQRRLVWALRHKIAFIKTVLDGLPFPEIYLAAGDVDLETGKGTLLLVDGQQRISTLNDYFSASPELRLGKELLPYAKLAPEEKKRFLEYSVVVRDLGNIDILRIKEIFRRINSTQYSLNAMEIDNARYDGEFKTSADELSRLDLFEDAKFFSPNEIRRMGDLRFVLSLMITMMSQYFNRDEELSTYLARFNDEFPERSDLEKRFRKIAAFIRDCQFPMNSRFWKKADFFTAFIELDRIVHLMKVELEPRKVREELLAFYDQVDTEAEASVRNEAVVRYARAALQATNDRSNRIARGTVVRDILAGRPELERPRFQAGS